MFEQLLESTTTKKSARNPWAYAISLVFQVLMLGVLILIPLLYTEALPQQQMLSWLVAPPPPPPPPPPPAAQQPVRRVKPVSLMEAGKLRAPREIPREITIIKDDTTQEDLSGVVGGVPGGVPGGQMGGVLGGVLGGIPGAVPPPALEAPKRIRVSSGVQDAKLIRKVEPAYPPLAKQARIAGTVRLEAVIAADGTIQNLRVIEGHPLLVQSALQAVQQWRYQPTLLSGEPVEVVTYIDVIFRLY